MESELNELKAKHDDELLALRVELDDTAEEFSVLSYNSRVVRVSDCMSFNLYYLSLCSILLLPFFWFQNVIKLSLVKGCGFRFI